MEKTKILWKPRSLKKKWKNLPKTPKTIKARLQASIGKGGSLSKVEAKFINYVKNCFQMTDQEAIQALWQWRKSLSENDLNSLKYSFLPHFCSKCYLASPFIIQKWKLSLQCLINDVLDPLPNMCCLKWLFNIWGCNSTLYVVLIMYGLLWYDVVIVVVRQRNTRKTKGGINNILIKKKIVFTEFILHLYKCNKICERN